MEKINIVYLIQEYKVHMNTVNTLHIGESSFFRAFSSRKKHGFNLIISALQSMNNNRYA